MHFLLNHAPIGCGFTFSSLTEVDFYQIHQKLTVSNKERIEKDGKKEQSYIENP
jgi:hypothetical protein